MLALGISAGAVVLFLLGTPIVLVIALWVAATSYLVVDFPLTNMGLAALDSLKSFAFLAVPLFIATGDLLTAGGISQKLIQLARSIVCFLPGRTAATGMMASGLFAAVSGSNAATAATMGAFLGPELRRRGISPGVSGAIVASGGTLGIVIPPSTMFIIYGITMGVSTSDLNLAGLLPGVVTMILLIVWGSYLTRRIEPSAGFTSFSFGAIAVDAARAYVGLIAIGILFCGLYFGWFSSTEAAGIAAIYCLCAAVFITRGLSWRQIPSVLQSSAAVCGIIAPLVAFSLQFQQIISVMGVQDVIQDILTTIGESYGTAAVVITMMALVLVFGCITESVAVVLILGPILAPVVASHGIDPVHWGVVFVLGTSIGFITPPYGLNLFVVSSVMNIPFWQLVRATCAFLVPLLIAWMIVAAFPGLSLYLQPMR